NGVACTASNECATNNCCGSVCSSSCTVTNTVSGSGGGGGISTTSRDVIIQSPSAISVPVGKENILYINITNNVPATKLNNITVKLSGYLPGLAEVEQQLDGIEYNETRQLKILLKAPIFLTGTYDLKVIIEGKLSGAQSKTITQEFVVKLTATSLTIGDAEGSVNNAAAAAKELSDAGIGTKRIEDLLSKAKASLADGDYATASSLANQAVSLKDKALSVKDALEDVSKKLEEAERAGLDVSETARYYSLAAEAFAREEFEKAEQRLNAASLTYVLETQGKINVVAFAYNNWYWILAFLAVSYVTGKAAHRRLMLIYINFMLKSLKDEERAINELLTETQNQFYREKTMDEPTYHKMMYEYEKRLTSMKKTMGRLIIMKARIISAESELEELEHEEEHVIDMTKELQTLYYKDRKINKHIYDRRQNEYHERRAEIREQIELLKEKMNLKKKKGSSPLFAILPLFLLIVPIIAFADLQGDAESALLSAQQDIDEMSGKGLSVISLSKLLDEARKLYNAKEYDGVILLTDQINATKSKALSISSKIDEVEGRMIDLESKGADVAPIRTELTKASAGLYGEEYAAADAAVEKAAALLEDLEGSFATSSTIERTRLDVIKIIYQNWLYITAFLIVVAATWRAAYIKLDTMRVSKRIEYLEYAEKHLKELMVRNQEAYYKEKTISKPDFLVSRDYYNKRMSELARELKVMMERLQKLKSMESSSLWLRLLAKRK
ncbi:MAG TPA: hypothetical protein VJH90_03985, partial [archaeon]|nr:hypothetical protein [archaeon]